MSFTQNLPSTALKPLFSLETVFEKDQKVLEAWARGGAKLISKAPNRRIKAENMYPVRNLSVLQLCVSLSNNCPWEIIFLSVLSAVQPVASRWSYEKATGSDSPRFWPLRNKNQFPSRKLSSGKRTLANWLSGCSGFGEGKSIKTSIIQLALIRGTRQRIHQLTATFD